MILVSIRIRCHIICLDVMFRYWNIRVNMLYLPLYQRISIVIYTGKVREGLLTYDRVYLGWKPNSGNDVVIVRTGYRFESCPNG